ncbi:aconitase family-domain-containing protein [Mycena floridula]|nr:aconitase family-domain-containing protein [Mycena floridula]
MSLKPRTLYDKIWDDHLIHQQEDGLALLYIDRHLVHEVSSPQAFEGLRSAGRGVRRLDCTLATVDHNVPTEPRALASKIDSYVTEPGALAQCLALERNVKDFGLTYFGLKDRRQGIVHIIGPENGFTLPGTICVCGDSHTSTHGAVGALAFGIGTSEVEHVLATQTLLQAKSKNMRITVEGVLPPGVTSKDVILHIIGVIGANGANGCVIEYTGPVIQALSMEARMSLCNMSIEAGARAGLVAPDQITFDYLRDRPLAPKGPLWDEAVSYWKFLRSDEGAYADLEVTLSASDIQPTVSWGTSPQDVVPISGRVPDPLTFTDPAKRASMERSLEYMGLAPNTLMEDIAIDKVFIGSCTNSRIEDLRAAAKVILAAGPSARVASGVRALVVPGSGMVKQHAEAEGIDTVFKAAGFEWREAGCSMCIGLNEDALAPGERCASTSNRNFEGRQGAGGRTHLLSPSMAAAAALNGKLTDVRKYGSPTAKLTEISATPSLQLDQIITPAEPLKPSVKPSQSSKVDTVSGSNEEKTFIRLEGLAAPLHMANVDTDMIIPKQFLHILTKTGLAKGLFYNIRFDPSGKPRPFVLDEAPYTNAKILVCTGKNFGCGSSREHAPWSLKDFGIRSVIAPSFGEIFANNMMQNGMLPVVLSVEECQELARDAEAGSPLRVDLENQIVERLNGKSPFKFTVNPFRRQCLLAGLDDIGMTMKKENLIDDFEQTRSRRWPWLDNPALVSEPLKANSASGRLDW